MSSEAYHAKISGLVRDLTAAHKFANTTTNDTIMSAARKPKGVSDVRWRIELRRRANPLRYALLGRRV